jgi:hypothetical protein
VQVRSLKNRASFARLSRQKRFAELVSLLLREAVLAVGLGSASERSEIEPSANISANSYLTFLEAHGE